MIPDKIRSAAKIAVGCIKPNERIVYYIGSLSEDALKKKTNSPERVEIERIKLLARMGYNNGHCVLVQSRFGSSYAYTAIGLPYPREKPSDVLEVSGPASVGLDEILKEARACLT